MTGYSKSITIHELVRSVRSKVVEALIKSKLDLDGVTVRMTTTKTNGGGERLWFCCPSCDRRCGKLFCSDSAFRCRKCLKPQFVIESQ